VATDDASVSWIAAADGAVRLAKNANEAQQKIDYLEEAERDLSRLIAEFRTLSVGAAVVRPFGWAGREPSTELARDLTTAAATFDSRALALVIRDLDHFKTEVRSALIEAWGKHAAERIGDVSELSVLANALSAVDGVVDLSRQLQITLGELARIQHDVPSPQAVALLKKAEETLGRLEESLQPDAVRRFLSAVGRGGASTALLSKDVIDWLASHNALGSFKIIAGSPVDTSNV
jgi:hypothetical protein